MEDRNRKVVLQLEKYFKNVPFFREMLKLIDQEFVMRAYKVMFVKEHARGETVFNYGDKGNLFYVILKGTVEVIAPLEIELEMDEKMLMIYLWEN